MIKFVSWNILCPAYAGPNVYFETDPKYLNPFWRFELIKSRLKVHINTGLTVFALQEVSQDWFNDLLVFFDQNNYTLIGSNYGNAKSHYMGVALAIPRSMELLKVDVTKCTDTYDFSEDEAFDDVGVDKSGWYDSAIKAVNSVFGWKTEKPFDLLAELKEKHNRIVSVLLKNGNRRFVVSNYHMPCIFEHQDFMTCHSAMALLHVQRFAETCGKVPYVFMGDFNMKFSDNAYLNFTFKRECRLARIKDALPEKCSRLCVSLQKTDTVNDAFYIAKYVTTPGYTCNSKVRWFKDGGKTINEFRDTVDHIFVSLHWYVESATVDGRSGTLEYQPNEVEPSDHCLIYAEMNIRD